MGSLPSQGNGYVMWSVEALKDYVQRLENVKIILDEKDSELSIKYDQQSCLSWDYFHLSLSRTAELESFTVSQKKMKKDIQELESECGKLRSELETQSNLRKCQAELEATISVELKDYKQRLENVRMENAAVEEKRSQVSLKHDLSELIL